MKIHTQLPQDEAVNQPGKVSPEEILTVAETVQPGQWEDMVGV